MSLRQNDEWLEAAYENFQENIELCQWDMAQAVIDDVRREGFTSASKVMTIEMSKKKLAVKMTIANE